MKYILFDADTKEYLDAFDEIGDWGFVANKFQTKDFTLIYRKKSSNDWTSTMFGHQPDLNCIRCDGKLEQTDGCNYSQYCETKYKCRQCEIELRMTWNKSTMKNRVIEKGSDAGVISDDDTCEEITI